MLDEDNDGEVSLGDITRAVFRRAPDRDLTRIRRFLEVGAVVYEKPPPPPPRVPFSHDAN